MNRFRSAGLALALVAGLGSSVSAQFGKIDGYVRAADKTPIVNATVTIVGQGFTTVTNKEGYYFLNNTPVGVYELSVVAIGFRRGGVTGLRVISGQTAAQDFALQSGGAVQLLDCTPPLLTAAQHNGCAQQERGARGGSQSGPSQPLRLRFQLITPTDNMKLEQDPSIAEVSAALKDLFSFQRYQLLDAEVLAVDFVPGVGPGGGSTTQQMVGDGNKYALRVTVDSVTPQGVRMGVSLMQAATPQWIEILRTKVTVSFDHTVVLGSTQPVLLPKPNSAQGGSTERTYPIILIVKPELRKPD